MDLGPLPGFNSVQSGGTNPNWALAGTMNLDALAYGDSLQVMNTAVQG